MVPDGAGVIEVDVREEQLPHVVEPDPFARQSRRKVIQGCRGARIDQRDAGRAVQNAGGDDLRAAEEIEIDVVETRG